MQPDRSTIIERLANVLESRKTERPSNSYTVKLFDGGIDAIGAKIREEADELIEAARTARQNQNDGRDVVHEAADLLYHTLVMLAHCDVTLAEVEAELARRFGISGLEEKARRTPPDT